MIALVFLIRSECNGIFEICVRCYREQRGSEEEASNGAVDSRMHSPSLFVALVSFFKEDSKILLRTESLADKKIVLLQRPELKVNLTCPQAMTLIPSGNVTCAGLAQAQPTSSLRSEDNFSMSDAAVTTWSEQLAA